MRKSTNPPSYQAIVKIDNFFQIGINCNSVALTQLSFLSLDEQILNQQIKQNSSTQIEQLLLEQVLDQIKKWEKQPAFKFTVPIQLIGSDFQQQVWQQIKQISYGQTCSYGEIAKFINNYPRAVGQACGSNPIPVIVPCHRVLGKNSLGGFNRSNGGYLLDIKRWLLERENYAAAKK